METEAKPNASPKTPLIEVYYTSRSRFGDNWTEIDSEGYFSKIYPSIQEVKEEWKQVPSFAIQDMITDNITDSRQLTLVHHHEICHRLFMLMNDYDTNILAGYDNKNALKMDHLQPWVVENETHTSMSVNDVISIDGTFYLCDNIGWKALAETPLLGKKLGPISR